MTEWLREQALAALENDWGSYVERFHSLPAEAQAAFLALQGYARLADLLAHIVAWWQEGRRVMDRLGEDPGFIAQDYDVDAFNALAVASARDQDEAVVLASFEAMRQHLIQLVTRLPPAAFENQRLAERLRIEVVGHLAEHALAAA